MNIAVLLSGGIGSRLQSDIPKQYIDVGDGMIVTRTLNTLLEHSMVDLIRIVAEDVWRDTITEETGQSKKVIGFSKPGANRQLSIYNALVDLSEVASDDDVILVQDAVRPFTTPDTITGCLTNIEGHDGALPVIPMKDTIYLSRDGNTVSGLLDRNELFAGQAPEAYRYGKYRQANEELLPDRILEINGAAEPAIIAGMDVAMFAGDENNFKITTKADLQRYREIVG